jgi:polyhydroxybutyrate depolymerase
VRPAALAAALVALIAHAGCLDRLERCGPGSVGAGDDRACPTPGWTDRAFDLHVPAAWDGRAPLPVILLFHGGGGNRASSDRTTCPGGDVTSPGCFVAAARARGFAVVVPDGTGGRPLRGIRTWNAGGGADGWDCVSGAACAAGVDDIAYVTDVLDEVGAALPLDPARLYASGLSNGAALAHRLACELPRPLAAIAPVGGANQHTQVGGACPRPTAVLQLHGADDPCWPFDGGPGSCIDVDGDKAPVLPSLERWRTVNGCAATFVDTPVPDRDPTDGVTVVHRVWDGCAQATELYRQDGGGHTWPSGWPYLGEDRVGRVGRDLDSGAILDFFEAHRGP